MSPILMGQGTRWRVLREGEQAENGDEYLLLGVWTVIADVLAVFPPLGIVTALFSGLVRRKV